MKSLVFIKAHYISDVLAEEYYKIKRSGVDCFVLFDNKDGKYPMPKNYELTTIEPLGDDIPVLLTDFELYEKLELPGYYDERDCLNFPKFLWYNSDYPIYIVLKLFPDYDFYWQTEYDVYCNGDSYEQFFNKYKDDSTDFLAVRMSKSNADWWAIDKTDWVWNKGIIRGACILPLVRVSKRAAEFLYTRRIEHGKLYEQLKENENVRWVYCEAFVSTELGNHKTYTTGEILGQNINDIGCIDLTNLQKDNLLYHPVKCEKKALNEYGYIMFLP